MCEPRLKSHRTLGSDRDAGCAWSSGTSKRDSAAIPPDATREQEMLRAWVALNVEDIVVLDGRFDGYFGI